MKRIGLLKKVLVNLFVFALLFTNAIVVHAEINPEHAIIGNNSPSTAYNIGHWKYKISKLVLLIKIKQKLGLNLT